MTPQVGDIRTLLLEALGLAAWEAEYLTGADLVRQVDAAAELSENVTPKRDDPEWCPHPPGSQEKIEWLARRVAMGYRLWHPDDEPGEGHQAPPLQLFGRLRRGAPDEANRLRSVREPRVRRVVRR